MNLGFLRKEILCNNKDIPSILIIQCVCVCVCIRLAEKCKEEGNQAYKAKDYQMAVALYSDAISKNNNGRSTNIN